MNIAFVVLFNTKMETDNMCQIPIGHMHVQLVVTVGDKADVRAHNWLYWLMTADIHTQFLEVVKLDSNFHQEPNNHCFYKWLL